MEQIRKYSTEYKYKDEVYKIELSSESNGIILKCTEKSTHNIIPSLFTGKYEFNELKDKNKFLRIYDTIDELLQFFKDILNQNKLSIIKESNNLKTIWSFIKGISEDNIQLILTEGEMKKDDIIDTLVNEIKNLKTENLKVNKKVTELEKRISLLEEKMKGKEKEIFNNKNGLVNKIITNQKEAQEFSKFLFKNDNTQFKLLYQATRDGDKISDIEQKVKGYSPTVFLIFTKRGIKCGGYTQALWKIDNNSKFDSSAFLYNFSTKKIFPVKDPKEAIYCRNDVFCFGNYFNSDYFIRNSFLTQKIYEAKSKKSYYSEDYEIQGENESEIEELEIYLKESI